MTLAAHIVSTAEPRTPEWHKARESGLGGSEVAAVLGLSKWESRFSLWWRKQGRAPQVETPEMEWGRRLEPVLFEKFQDEHPDMVLSKAPGTYARDGAEWMRANVDGLVWENPDEFLDLYGPPSAIWEAKCAYDDTGWGPDGTDQIPIYYRCQVLWYLLVTGLRRAYVSVLISGSDYREYAFDIDPADEAVAAELELLRSSGAEFMESLPFDGRPGVKPDIDAHSQTLRVIRSLPDGVDDEPVDVDPHLADAYLSAVDAYRAAEAEKRLRTSQVLDLLGNAKYAHRLGSKFATRATKADGTTHRLTPSKQKEDAHV